MTGWLDLTPQGLIGDIAGKLIDTVAGFFPNPEEKAKAAQALETLRLQGAFHTQELQIQLLLQQAKTNQVEAASRSLWVAGWRPGVGWTCGAALAYSYVLQPFLVFVMTALGHPLTGLPTLDLSQLMPVLVGMLGLGYMRTQEKLKGMSRGD